MQKKIVYNKIFNKEFRTRLINNPSVAIQELVTDSIVDNTINYKTVVSTKNIFYFVIPYISEETNINELESMRIQAGADHQSIKASTVGSIGTAGTLSSFSGSVSCFSKFRLSGFC